MSAPLGDKVKNSTPEDAQGDGSDLELIQVNIKSVATVCGVTQEQVNSVLSKLKDMILFICRSKQLVLNLAVG